MGNIRLQEISLTPDIEGSHDSSHRAFGYGELKSTSCAMVGQDKDMNKYKCSLKCLLKPNTFNDLYTRHEWS